MQLRCCTPQLGVPMDLCDDIEKVDEPALAQIIQYWYSIRRGALPSPCAVDPLDLKPHLGRLSIVETAPQLEGFRFRLFGVHLASEFQQERTGLCFGELREIEHWETVFGPYQYVRDAARIHYQPRRTVSGLRSHRGYARVLLPLSSDGAKVDRILAAFEFVSLP